MTGRRIVFRFAVITDSHFTESDAKAQPYYPSNRLFNRRNRQVVDLLNAMPLECVIHLGDIPHLVPGMGVYGLAVEAAQQAYSRLSAPLYVSPGNHDIGDKPNSGVPAPVVCDAFYNQFEHDWGPAFSDFSHGDCAFILFDTPVLNSGHPREQEQMDWLTDRLKRFSEENKRIFLGSHYPLFIDSIDESEHYDNIAQPARSRLVELIDRYRVTAVFSGHAHNFFYNRINRTDFFSLPATGFTRPEYSELFFIEPALEFGRDDFAKLGFFVVSVYEDGYDLDLIRLHRPDGEFDSNRLVVQGLNRTEPVVGAVPLGFSLRNSWAARIEMACSDLDEFQRKTARNDHAILALLDLKIKNIRLPFNDLLSPQSRERLTFLVGLGFKITIYSLGRPDEGKMELIAGLNDLVQAWEIILDEDDLAQIETVLAKTDWKCRRIILSKIMTPSDEMMAKYKYFSHFVASGFMPGEVARLGERLNRSGQAGLVDGCCCTVVNEENDIWGYVRECVDLAVETGWPIDLNIQMKRDAEGVCFDDETAVANRVAESFLASLLSDRVRLHLDTFIDHDRGYFPRRAVLDRRYNPRTAYYILKNLTSLLNEFTESNFSLRRLESGEGTKAFALETDRGGFVAILFEKPANVIRLTLPRSNWRIGEIVGLDDGLVVDSSAEDTDSGRGETSLRFNKVRSMPVALRCDTD